MLIYLRILAVTYGFCHKLDFSCSAHIGQCIHLLLPSKIRVFWVWHGCRYLLSRFFFVLLMVVAIFFLFFIFSFYSIVHFFLVVWVSFIRFIFHVLPFFRFFFCFFFLFSSLFSYVVLVFFLCFCKCLFVFICSLCLGFVSQGFTFSCYLFFFSCVWVS